MIPKVEIKLSDNKIVYFPGDKLEGRVFVDVPADTSVKGMENTFLTSPCLFELIR